MPELEVLAATLTHTLRPLGRVGSHHGLQGADGHTVLGPVAVEVGVRGQEVGHHLLSGGFIPAAGVGGEDIDARELGKHFGNTFHAGHVSGMPGEAFDLNDVAFAAELLSQPLRGGLRPFLLVDPYIVYAGHIEFLVHRYHQNTRIKGLL